MARRPAYKDLAPDDLPTEPRGSAVTRQEPPAKSVLDQIRFADAGPVEASVPEPVQDLPSPEYDPEIELSPEEIEERLRVHRANQLAASQGLSSLDRAAMEERVSLMDRDLIEVKPGTNRPVSLYEVTETFTALIHGTPMEIKAGRLLSPNQFDIGGLQRQGARLKAHHPVVESAPAE